MESSWRPVSSDISEGSILGPILLNFFINDLDNRRQYTLSKFADVTRRGSVVDIPEGCAATQRDHNRLKEWADSNLMKFNKGKCKVLRLERNNPMQQYTLGANWLESCLAEKALGVMVDNVNVSQQCALAAKASSILGSTASRMREVFFTSWDQAR